MADHRAATRARARGRGGPHHNLMTTCALLADCLGHLVGAGSDGTGGGHAGFGLTPVPKKPLGPMLLRAPFDVFKLLILLE